MRKYVVTEMSREISLNSWIVCIWDELYTNLWVILVNVYRFLDKKEKIMYGPCHHFINIAEDKDKLGSRFLQKISMVESALSGSDLKEFQNLVRKGFSDKNMKHVLQDFIVNLKKKRRSGENNVIIIE